MTDISERPITAPEGFPICIRAYGDETESSRLGHLVGALVCHISRTFDLSGLDGMTIAGDYVQALAELDRGYAATIVLTPSEGDVIGIAMTPSVLRDGVLKSHLVFNASLVSAVLDDSSEHYQLAIHMIAHECAHVEITRAFDTCFPGVQLRTRHSDPLRNLRWNIIFACWEEYAATRWSSCYGQDPTVGYEDTFLLALGYTEDRANAAIRSYRWHADVGQVLREVSDAYGQLMKFAAYHLGNMAGQGLADDDLPRTKQALDGHWFQPVWLELRAACETLWDGFGRWEDQTGFEAIGDIAVELMANQGMSLTPLDGDGIHVDLPFTPQTEALSFDAYLATLVDRAA